MAWFTFSGNMNSHSANTGILKILIQFKGLLCMTTKLREWCVVNASKNHRASVSYINNKLPLLCSITPHIILQRSNR